VIVLEISSH